jgi:hypothetical protein
VCGYSSGIFINYRNPNDYMIAKLYDDVNNRIKIYREVLVDGG